MSEDLKKEGIGAAPENVSIKMVILNVKDAKSEMKLSANKSAKKMFTNYHRWFVVRYVNFYQGS